LSKEEPIDIIHRGNLFVEQPIQININLIIEHLIKSKLNSNFNEPKLIQQGDNNLLTRQSVKNQFVSLNFAQSNDVLINLITSVDFIGTIFFNHNTKNQRVIWNVFSFFQFGFPYIS
jgi:hypothetical protein